MARKPWIKWFPADWRGEPRLKMCSLAARGLWADILSYCHEGEPYGHFLIEGQQPTLSQIAALVGRPEREVKKALAELIQFKVCGETESGTLYSRRMIRDKAKADQDSENGRLGGNPRLTVSDKGGVNPQDNQEDKAHMPEARSQTDANASVARVIKAEFADWYSGYPHKVGRGAAENAFKAARKKTDLETLKAGLKRYIDAKPAERQWCNPATWLNQERWADQEASAKPAEDGERRKRWAALGGKREDADHFDIPENLRREAVA